MLERNFNLTTAEALSPSKLANSPGKDSHSHSLKQDIQSLKPFGQSESPDLKQKKTKSPKKSPTKESKENSPAKVRPSKRSSPDKLSPGKSASNTDASQKLQPFLPEGLQSMPRLEETQSQVLCPFPTFDNDDETAIKLEPCKTPLDE
jgi:hypothetical protein